MAKKFASLRETMSAQAREQSRALADRMLKDMPLHELRQARGLSQQDLAKLLNVQQPAIARLERRTDMYLSTLRGHIQAMGGELEILAKFPDGVVRITNFSTLDEKDTAPR